MAAFEHDLECEANRLRARTTTRHRVAANDASISFPSARDHRSRPWARVHCHRSAKAVQMLPLLVLSEAVLVLVIVIEAVRRWRFGNAFNRDSQSGQPRHDPLRRDHRRTWVPTVVPTWVQDRVTSSEVRIPGYTSRNDRPHRPRVGGSLPDRYRG